MGEDEHPAEFVLSASDTREVRLLPELLAEVAPFAEVGGVGFACLLGVGVGGTFDSSAEITLELILFGTGSRVQGTGCG